MSGYADSSAPCNSCGTQEPAAKVRTCSHCPTLICLRCRANHEVVCEDNQKKKAKGIGPTIRNAVPEKPQAIVPRIDRDLAAVADLLTE